MQFKQLLLIESKFEAFEEKTMSLRMRETVMIIPCQLQYTGIV